MPELSDVSAGAVARKRAIRFGSLRKAREATGIAVGTWVRIESGANVERPTIYRVAEALWDDPRSGDELLAGRDPDAASVDEGSYDYGTYVAETPDHVQRTIDDLLMQHSASFRRARGGS